MPCLYTCQLVIATVFCFSLFSKVHISFESMIPYHCHVDALSYPQDNDDIDKRDHERNARCDRCDILPIVFLEIQGLGSVDCDEERDEMEYQIPDYVSKSSIRHRTKFREGYALEGMVACEHVPYSLRLK